MSPFHLSNNGFSTHVFPTTASEGPSTTTNASCRRDRYRHHAVSDTNTGTSTYGSVGSTNARSTPRGHPPTAAHATSSMPLGARSPTKTSPSPTAANAQTTARIVAPRKRMADPNAPEVRCTSVDEHGGVLGAMGRHWPRRAPRRGGSTPRRRATSRPDPPQPSPRHGSRSGASRDGRPSGTARRRLWPWRSCSAMRTRSRRTETRTGPGTRRPSRAGEPPTSWSAARCSVTTCRRTRAVGPRCGCSGRAPGWRNGRTTSPGWRAARPAVGWVLSRSRRSVARARSRRRRAPALGGGARRCTWWTVGR